LINEGKAIPVFGDGTTRRDYTFIDDIIAGVSAAIDFTGSDYEVINLGESRTVELRELISLLEKELKQRLDIHEAAIVSILQRVMDIIDPPIGPPTPEKPKIGFKP